MLYRFRAYARKFVKVIPRDYERVLDAVAAAEAAGTSHEEALQVAFDQITGRK